MEQVEKSVNKWKKEEDYTRKSFGRVFGAIYGMAVGFLIGILYDKVFMWCVIGFIVGMIAGGMIGSKYKNHKKYAAYLKEHPELDIPDETENNKFNEEERKL